VDEEGGDRHSREHDPPPVSKGVRHRHQLRLVAEFGDEDDTEADKSGGQHQ
jgi:hypothetical protein